MNDNRCVCCGRIIPDGRQVCPMCEKEAGRREKAEYWWNEWIFPLGVGGLIIFVLVKILSI